jgi:hypothetical protein
MWDQLRAWIKLLLSFRKKNWDLCDYPLRVRCQASADDGAFAASSECAWSAQIINWWAVDGLGPTREAALNDLRQQFDSIRSDGHELPRPGTEVPIELASAELVRKYEAIAREFLPEILGINYEDCIITDESTLFEFDFGDEAADHIQKVMVVYGVDISDIQGRQLGLIFQRISQSLGRD